MFFYSFYHIRNTHQITQTPFLVSYSQLFIPCVIVAANSSNSVFIVCFVAPKSHLVKFIGWPIAPSAVNFIQWLSAEANTLICLGKGSKKKIEKKLTNVSFMYVCVAGNGEMLVFFSFFPQQ